MAGGGADTLQFRFTSGGNMKSQNDAHMHEVTIRFVDEDHLHSEWTLYEAGKKKEVKTFDLVRKTARS